MPGGRRNLEETTVFILRMAATQILPPVGVRIEALSASGRGPYSSSGVTCDATHWQESRRLSLSWVARLSKTLGGNNMAKSFAKKVAKKKAAAPDQAQFTVIPTELHEDGSYEIFTLLVATPRGKQFKIRECHRVGNSVFGKLPGCNKEVEVLSDGVEVTKRQFASTATRSHKARI